MTSLTLIKHPRLSCCWQITWLKIERPFPPSLVFFLFLSSLVAGLWQAVTYFFPDLLRHATLPVKHRWQNCPNLILWLQTKVSANRVTTVCTFFSYQHFLSTPFRGQKKIDSNLQRFPAESFLSFLSFLGRQKSGKKLIVKCE